MVVYVLFTPFYFLSLKKKKALYVWDKHTVRCIISTTVILKMCIIWQNSL